MGIISLMAMVQGMAQSFQATTYHEEDGLASNTVFDISQVPGGSILAATNRGVSKFDGTDWVSFHDSLELPNSRNTQFYQDTKGNVWLLGYHHSKLVLAYYDDKEWHFLPSPPDASVYRFVTDLGIDISQDQAGQQKLLISTPKGIFQFRQNSQNWSTISTEALPEGVVIREIFSHNGQLHVITNSGLWKQTPPGELVRVPLELPNNNLVCMVAATNGSGYYLLGDAWLGKVSEGQFTLLVKSFPKMLNESFRTAGLMVLENEQVIFGINSMFRLYDHATQSIHPLDFSGQIESFWHNNVFSDRQGNIWISTDRGLALIHDLRFQYFNHSHGMFEDEVSGVIPWDDRSFLIGGNYFLGLITPERCQTIFAVEPSDKQFLRFSNFHRAKDGAIYFSAHDDGIGRVLPDQTFEWVIPTPIDQGISALLPVDSGIYVACQQQLFFWDGKEYERITKVTGYIRQILARNGQLWLLTSFGIFVQHSDGSWDQYRGGTENLSSVTKLYDFGGKTLVGTHGGLGQLLIDTIIPARLRGTSIDRPIFDLLIDRHKNLWVGTDYGVYIVDSNDSVRHFNRKNGLIGNDVNRGTMTECEDGRITIGTEHGLGIYLPTRDLPQRTVPPIPKIYSAVTNKGQQLNPVEAASLEAGENGLEFVIRAITFIIQPYLEYRVKLEGFDEEWQQIQGSRSLVRNYTNLPGGNYQLRFQVRHPSGIWSEEMQTAVYEIKGPFYLSWWFITLSVLLLISIGFLINRLAYNYRVNTRLRQRVKESMEVIRQSDNNLKEQNQQLTKLNRELDGFVYRVAHDLRGPLMKLLGLVNVYRQEELKNVELLDYMEQSIEQMDDFIKDLLNFTRNSRKETELRSIDLSAAVQAIFDTYDNPDRTGTVKKTISLRQDQSFVSDFQRVNILLQNLISNAIHYRDTKADTSFVHVEIAVTELTAHIEISDNGVGISTEDQEQIFEMFYRGTTEGNGSGLGLFIVAEVLEKLKGSVKVQSEPGKGTTFKVTLPNHLPDSANQKEKTQQKVAPF